MNKYDVIIIGAGVSGAAVARELAREQRRIAVLEKASDICEGTSKANSGLVHAGHDAIPGTLKARLNVLGNEKMENLARELNFPFHRNGSLVLSFEEKGIGRLEELLERGKQNGVKGLRILSSDEVRELEPKVSEEVIAALYSPMGGIVCPFGLNEALAENACENGVEFYFEHEVVKIEKYSTKEQGFRIWAGGKEFTAKIVINAAGLHADELHNMISNSKICIAPRRGEYCLLDKKIGKMVGATLFQLPSDLGKGVLVTPTVHGNLLIGPTAEDIIDKEGVNTTTWGLEQVLELGRKSVPGLPIKEVITSFAGLRARLSLEGFGSLERLEGLREQEGHGDFIIGESKDVPGFFDIACIDSPGLTCSPAIGEYVLALIQKKYPAPPNNKFISKRRGYPNIASSDEETRRRLIVHDPAYANVICRCELVTEGEIRNAINRPLGATTLDGVKRRTRAGMGRCQGGFCSPKVMEILADELGVDVSEITKKGGGCFILSS